MVCSLQRKPGPDTVGLALPRQTSLQGIATKAKIDKIHRFENLFGLLNADLLRRCWKDLNKKAASGVDKLTAAEYEKDFEADIRKLVERLKSGHYHARLIKRHYIPKEEGKMRPLGIPVVEDKLLQLAAAGILDAIFEQDFMDCSFGYRRNIGALDAVKELSRELQFGRYGYVVDADIKGFFDNIDHDWLITMLEQRVNDRPFLNLIRKWLKAGVLEPDGVIIHPVTGTPQGGVISSVLANVYLHFALDLWFEKVIKRDCKGASYLSRYSDDFVCTFQIKAEAEAFYGALADRLKKFGLSLSVEKTRILHFSRFSPGLERRFSFLGFEFYWDRDRKGTPRVRRRTDRKRLNRSVKNCKEWLKKNRNFRLKKLFSRLNAKLRGYYNYYGVIGNYVSLRLFFREVIWLLFRWLNRRSQRRSLTWEMFHKVLERLGIERPRITEKRVRKLRQLVWA
ncbi:MAG: group II intron reverse transcriptase/maturase [bacterium]|nr:group II intron reverse transcriptase/maturase [bacterium]